MLYLLLCHLILHQICILVALFLSELELSNMLACATAVAKPCLPCNNILTNMVFVCVGICMRCIMFHGNKLNLIELKLRSYLQT